MLNFIIAAVWIFVGWSCGTDAARRQRFSPEHGVLAGMILGPLSFLLYFVGPDPVMDYEKAMGHPPTSFKPPAAGWHRYISRLGRASRGRRRWMWHQLSRSQQIELLRIWHLSGMDPFELNAGKLASESETPSPDRRVVLLPPGEVKLQVR